MLQRKLWIYSIIFCLVMAVTFPKSAICQNDSISIHQTGYLHSYFYNGIGLLKSPLKWNGEDWSKATAAILVTGLTLTMDDAISEPIFKWQSQDAKNFGKAGKFIGNLVPQLSISALSIGYGAITKNQKVKNFGLDNLQSQVYIGGLTYFIKEITHRARPFTGLDKYSFSGPFKNGGYESFYSGHSALAFGTATMLYLHSKKNIWVGVAGYSIATGIAVSRLQKQEHWASDVILGAIMGSAISTFVYKQQEKRRFLKQSLKPLP